MADPGGAPDAAYRPGRARSARYAGLVVATLLTVAGWLGGALPDAPATTPVGIWRGPHGPL
ncbi:DUF2029 domain-containing protein, partial [Micromonospora sp. ATA51]|nr:DUF2029 domain-containing protein [Micromonospora sp. ATA51]